MGREEANAESFEYVCRLCGETFASRKKKPGRLKCSVCGEHQGWMSTAPQPRWWPRWIPTQDNGYKRVASWIPKTDNGFKRVARWTNYVIVLGFLSLAAAILVSVFVISSIYGSEGESQGPKKGRDIPNVVGMNLQSAQDCLQEWGFYNLDDQPASSSDSKFQVFDRDWTVRRQSAVGRVPDSDLEIVLYASENSYGSTFCP